MSGRRLHVCLLWHHHQPPYRDALTEDQAMPWARLHAVKAYTDMAAICEAVPQARVTFNLVPSLLDQLDEIAAGSVDDFARLTRLPAEHLTPAEKERIAGTFFSMPFETMIAPWPRYRDLFYAARSRLHEMTPAELRDLQVWFNLAWCGPTVRNERARELVARGLNFSPADKAELLAIHQLVAGDVAPRYRRLQERGQIELTCSPYYHPILPLLCSSHAARDAKPDAVLPDRTWRHPEDARAHLERAFSSHAERFGRPPTGIWPSEGAISAEAVELIGEAGFKWLVSDQMILHKSKCEAQPDIYAPWDLGSGVAAFFRDHDLSDRIGFVYSRWRTEDAVADFMNRIREIRHHQSSDVGVVTVALDGENCWEHYPNDSPGLLVPLYEALANEPGIEMSTLSDALQDVGTKHRRVTRVGTGSWIDGTLETWMGHPKQNRAWDELAAVREALPEGEPLPETLMKAQASDWFWWLGPFQSTPFETEFTTLFARNLQKTAETLAVPPPLDTVAIVLGADPDKANSDQEPTQPITLTEVNGDAEDFYRWNGSGHLAMAQDAMARARRVKTIRFGFDATHLYLRLEPAEQLRGFQVDLTGPDGSRVAVFPERGSEVQSAMTTHLEVGVPLSRLATSRNGQRRVRFGIELRRPADTSATERLPRSGWFSISVDLGVLAFAHWSV